jgi:DNA-binding transcriptional LysR family regulator
LAERVHAGHLSRHRDRPVKTTHRIFDKSNAFIFAFLMQNCYRLTMNLRNLRAFTTIADEGGFARAATRLHLSQPALSRQIQALEADLGVRLFDRVGRRVQLTSQGEGLLRRSRRLLAEADSLGERARELRSGETGILRIAATPQVIENLLAPFLAQYRRNHPGVEVHLVEDGGERLLGRLERGEVHLCLASAGPTGFDGRLLYPMHVIAAVPAAHRLDGRAVPEIAELAHEPLLLPQRGFGSREWFENACDVAHIRPPVFLESAAPHTLVALAATDYAIAILPSNAHVLKPGVSPIPLVHRGASIGRWAQITWDPERFLAPYAEHFVTELTDFCRRDFPGMKLVEGAPTLPRPAAKQS